MWSGARGGCWSARDLQGRKSTMFSRQTTEGFSSSGGFPRHILVISASHAILVVLPWQPLCRAGPGEASRPIKMSSAFLISKNPLTEDGSSATRVNKLAAGPRSGAPTQRLRRSQYSSVSQLESVHDNCANDAQQTPGPARRTRPCPGPDNSRASPDASVSSSTGVVTVLWLRGTDLRTHDNAALLAAARGASALLPVFVFDAAEFGTAAQPGLRASRARASLLRAAVADLRARLGQVGSVLAVRVGKAEEVLAGLVAAARARRVVCGPTDPATEPGTERSLAAAVRRAGARLESVGHGTLFHPDDVPFQAASVPANLASFRESVAGVRVRAPEETPASLPGPPPGIDMGPVPSLDELCPEQRAASAEATRVHAWDGPSPEVHGEAQALCRVEELAKMVHAGAMLPTSALGKLQGELGRWMALGCLSPRYLYSRLCAPASGGFQKVGARRSTMCQWLERELLWRDLLKWTAAKAAAARSQQAPPASPLALPSPQPC